MRMYVNIKCEKKFHLVLHIQVKNMFCVILRLLFLNKTMNIYELECIDSKNLTKQTKILQRSLKVYGAPKQNIESYVLQTVCRVGGAATIDRGSNIFIPFFGCWTQITHSRVLSCGYCAVCE